jgi:ATP-binding cassette subfamily B protein
MQITSQFNSIIMGLSGAERIFALIDEPIEENNGKVRLVFVKEDKGELVESDKYTGLWAWKKDDELIPLKGDVRLNNVHFSYVKGKEVIHDISLYAKPGQKIAFVGATGAGKTTITNLINRFYDVDVGKIRYDGINIKKIKKDDLRRSLGLVLQDTNLFTGTIKDNIKYGKLNATDEEVIEAAKIANAHNFISKLPNGYDTMLTENGIQLSQGQRQLLSIARCAINNPPVMILDEATSSIDTRTEKIVQDGMDSLMNGRTVFVIAHRLSTVRNAKAIIVLEHGKIIERGNHEQLLELKGEYYQLYTGAFELE